MKKRIGVQFKSLGIAIAVLTLTVAILLVLDTAYLRTVCVEGLQKDASMVGRGVRVVIYKNLEFRPLEKLPGMSSYLNGLAGEYRDLSYLYIADARNKILYHSDGASYTGRMAPRLEGELKPRSVNTWGVPLIEGNYEVVIPIVKGKIVVGTVRVGISREFVDVMMTETIRRNLQIFGVTVLLTSGFLYFLFTIGVTKPTSELIGRLARIINKLGLNAGMGKDKDAYELDDLAKIFDTLAKALEEETVSKEYVQGAIKGITDPLFLVDRDGAIRVVNKKACDVMGRQRKELVGRRIKDFFSPKDVMRLGLENRTFIDLTLDDPGRSYDVSLVAKDGRHIPVLISTSVINDENNVPEGALYTVKDITILRQSEDELKRLNESLKSNERAVLNILADLNKSHDDLKNSQTQLVRSAKMASLGRLVSDMAHEVNNPLMIISGRAQLAMMEGTTRGEIEENLKIVLDQCARAKEIIERLLVFSRPGKGDVAKIDINAVVDFVAKLLEYQYSLAGIGIVREYDQDLPNIMADEKQLHEVFMNIFKNSSEAMPHGGQITIRTRRDGKNVAVDISDNGIGIPENMMAEIFDPFFTTKEHGTGLGLAVCYGIVRSHSGDLKLKSTVGKGTTASVIFPILQKAKDA